MQQTVLHVECTHLVHASKLSKTRESLLLAHKLLDSDTAHRDICLKRLPSLQEHSRTLHHHNNTVVLTVTELFSSIILKL